MVHEAVTNLVADIIATHCMNCNTFWHNACVHLCSKVDSEMPITLRDEYIWEWARQKDLLIAIYHTPISSQDFWKPERM